jgi:L-threonylcarbamoyladenylate synthase
MAAEDAIKAAARLLEAGSLVAFPTETVYGLGADAENPQAVAAIYAAKGRPSNHPVIVHLAPEADISYWASDIPEHAKKLIAAFWPGPLTMILKRAAHIPEAVSGGQDSIGLRCPSHPVAQALLREFKGGRGGVAAPSANKFGHVSPTTAQHVRDEFGTELPSILDGGQSEVGIESTIVDLSRGGLALLRPGGIGAERIAAVLGIEPTAPDAAAPRVSGALDSHYAPATPVVVVDVNKLPDAVRQLHASGKRVVTIQREREGLGGALATRMMPVSPDGYAHDLYAALRAMDHAGGDVIVVEAPPLGQDWAGVNDRLRRAAFNGQSVANILNF